MKQNNIQLEYVAWNRRHKMCLLAGTAIAMILFGIFSSTPRELFSGLYTIITHPDVLITDYILIGGLGAAFLNSGLLALIITTILWKNGDPFNGPTFASILIVIGFSFLGKNLLNVWPILIGVALYSKIHKEPFSQHVYAGLFGTAMAPIVTEVVFHVDLILPLRVVVGIILGIMLGYVLPPLAKHFLKSGKGYNLYNIGFVAGLLLTVLVSVFISFGYVPVSQALFAEGYEMILAVFLYTLSGVYIIVGLSTDKNVFHFLKRLFKRPGKSPTDFIKLDGFSATCVNMGLNGIIAVSYLLLVGGDLNGAMFGPIFAVIGFGAFGKHARTIFPIFAGILLGGFLGFWDISSTAMVMAALLGTALAPISGTYGWPWGIIVGILHGSLVTQIGTLHAGLNLYNNGFSTGIVAMITVPIFEEFLRPLPVCKTVSEEPTKVPTSPTLATPINEKLAP